MASNYLMVYNWNLNSKEWCYILHISLNQFMKTVAWRLFADPKNYKRTFLFNV